MQTTKRVDTVCNVCTCYCMIDFPRVADLNAHMLKGMLPLLGLVLARSMFDITLRPVFNILVFPKLLCRTDITCYHEA